MNLNSISGRITNKDSKIIGKVYRNLLGLQLTNSIAAVAASMVNGVMVSSFLGSNAMAAFGIVTPLFVIISSLAGVFSLGSQVLCGRYMGKGEIKRVEKVLSSAFFSVFVIGGILTALLLTLTTPVAALFGADSETIEQATQYIRGIAPCCIPIMLAGCFNPFLQLDRDENRFFRAIIFMTATNIILDFVVVKFTSLGLLGMGLASSAGYFVSAIVQGIHFLKKDTSFKVNSKSFSFTELVQIVKNGISNATGYVVFATSCIVVNRMLMMYGGVAAVAARSSESTVATLFDAIGAGFGAALVLVTSISIGEKDGRTVSNVLKKAFELSFIAAAVCAVITVPFAKTISGIFVKDDMDQLVITARAIRAYGLSMIPYMMGKVYFVYLSTLGKPGMLNKMYIFYDSMYVVVLFFTAKLGPELMWIFMPIVEIILLTMFYLVNKKHIGRFPKNVSDILMLPDNFVIPEDRKMNAIITNQDDLQKLEDQIREFCERNGVDKKRTMYAQLSLEEMTLNVIKFGFTEKGDNVVDIFMTYDNEADELTIRFRDNCIAFNPVEKVSDLKYSPDAGFKNIGIHMIYELSKEMNYVQMLDLNVLTIRL